MVFHLTHYDHERRSGGEGVLRHLWLELTTKCNLQCVHCYADASPHLPLFQGLTTAHWIEVLREARAEGCRSVQFIGGEPLLHPDLEVLLRTARSLGYQDIEVFTNGTMLTPKWLELFVELQVKVAFSFYAASPEAHDAITGVKGSYYRTLRGIDLALAAGLPVRVGIIQVTQTDVEVESARKLLESRGVSHIGFDRMRRIGRADGDGFHADPLEQLKELCGACHNGNLCVTATGQAYPCIMARAWPVGDIREGLRHVIYGQKLAEFRRTQREFLANNPTAACNPDDCSPYCNPNCSPYCSPYCNPNCKPFEGCSPRSPVW